VTALDVCAIAVVAISILFAYARGVIRSLIGTAAWVVGFIAALAFTPALGATLPPVPDAPFVPYVISFVAIFVAALRRRAVAWPLRAVVRKAGMGFVDAALGATFACPRTRAHDRVRARRGRHGHRAARLVAECVRAVPGVGCHGVAAVAAPCLVGAARFSPASPAPVAPSAPKKA
jgi:hypothetical protein